MAAASGLAHKARAEQLFRMPLGDRTRHQMRAAALADEVDDKVALGALYTVGEQLFFDDHFGALLQRGLCFAHGRIHPADLRGVHLHISALGKCSLGDRVDNPRAAALAGADVLFKVQHFGAFL